MSEAAESIVRRLVEWAEPSDVIDLVALREIVNDARALVDGGNMKDADA